MAEIKINLYQNDGRKKYGEGLEQLMIQTIQHHLGNMVEQWDGRSMRCFQCLWVSSVYWWCDGGQKQPEEFWIVQGHTFCPDSAKCTKLSGRRFIVQVNNDPKTFSKKVDYFAMAKSVT